MVSPAVHSPRPPKATQLLETLLHEDFEQPLTDWKKSGLWQVGDVVTNQPTAHSGTRVAATNLSGPYHQWTDDKLTAPLVNLPELTSGEHLVLSIQESYQLESYQDYGFVELSTDGGVHWDRVISTRTGTTLNRWVESRFMLDEFAGQALMLRFRLRTDAEHHYAGWYIDSLTITREAQQNFNARVRNVNGSHLPYVYADIVVEPAYGSCEPRLREANFEVTEDGVKQTVAAVEAPQARPQTGLVDIVFVYDNSGSMREEQALVEHHIAAFIDELKNTELDFALGLVRYGEPDNGSSIRIENTGALTTDGIFFVNQILPDILSNNSFEPTYEAIASTAQAFSFRIGSQPIFIVITDEFAGQGNTTARSARQAVDEINGKLFAVTYADLFSDFEPLIERPSQLLNLLDPLTPITQQLLRDATNTYRLKYLPKQSKSLQQERQVRVNVKCGNKITTANAKYTPQSKPTIQLSRSTSDAHHSSHAEDLDIAISVNINDNVSPYVSSANLVYRTLGAPYQTIAMQQLSVAEFIAYIPKESVKAPGVEYYITTTDGENTASLPSVQPWNQPFAIAVQPNITPVIEHTPNLPDDGAVEVTARIHHAQQAQVYFRALGDLKYESVTMSAGDKGLYRAQLPSQTDSDTVLEYYIEAKDQFGLAFHFGHFDAPIQLHPKPSRLAPDAGY
ncbi:hypothetical protein GCM10025791_12170 [Halioxenophilus aromaticivorans]|uniref:VWFA domain-containing protein n=1 Tax=Halioxenophilus aromaticivorans TaxID=1306992 RepID=A0AAV3TZE8_9ALTE